MNPGTTSTDSWYEKSRRMQADNSPFGDTHIFRRPTETEEHLFRCSILPCIKHCSIYDVCGILKSVEGRIPG